MKNALITTAVASVIGSGAVAGAPGPAQQPGAEPIVAQRPEPPWFPLMTRTAQHGLVLWHPDAIRDGRLMIVETASGTACESPRIKWSGRWFPTYRIGTRHQALLPVRLGLDPGEKPLLVECGGVRATAEVEVFAGEYPESQLQVDPKFTKKPPDRVVEEQAAINAAFATKTNGRLWSNGWAVPTPGPETSSFGVKRVFNGRIASRHRGVDLDGEVGAPVVAANDGVVVLAAEDFYFTGSALFIDHGDQLFSMYFHLSRIDVSDGDHVERGQLIGAVGSSGRVTGPHLHFAIKYAGTYIDPRDLLAFEPGVVMSAALRAR